MSVQEMASNEVKKEREKVQKWYKEAATLGNFNHTTTTMFKCGKCGARETTYYQLQTRRYKTPTWRKDSFVSVPMNLWQPSTLALNVETDGNLDQDAMEKTYQMNYFNKWSCLIPHLWLPNRILLEHNSKPNKVIRHQKKLFRMWRYIFPFYWLAWSIFFIWACWSVSSSWCRWYWVVNWLSSSINDCLARHQLSTKEVYWFLCNFGKICTVFDCSFVSLHFPNLSLHGANGFLKFPNLVLTSNGAKINFCRLYFTRIPSNASVWLNCKINRVFSSINFCKWYAKESSIWIRSSITWTNIIGINTNGFFA